MPCHAMPWRHGPDTGLCHLNESKVLTGTFTLGLSFIRQGGKVYNSRGAIGNIKKYYYCKFLILQRV